MGRFSTSAQYFLEPTGTLDNESGRFETGHTMASKKFLQELQEAYIYPVWDLIKGSSGITVGPLSGTVGLAAADRDRQG
jgi:hypothetical protein